MRGFMACGVFGVGGLGGLGFGGLRGLSFEPKVLGTYRGVEFRAPGFTES